MGTDLEAGKWNEITLDLTKTSSSGMLQAEDLWVNTNDLSTWYYDKITSVFSPVKSIDLSEMVDSQTELVGGELRFKSSGTNTYNISPTVLVPNKRPEFASNDSSPVDFEVGTKTNVSVDDNGTLKLTQGCTFSDVDTLTADFNGTHTYTEAATDSVKLVTSQNMISDSSVYLGGTTVSGITNDGAYAYVISRGAPAIMSKIRLSDMTNISNYTFNTGENDVFCVTNDGTYAYVPISTSPYKVAKILMSNMTRVATLTLNSDEYSYAITTDGTYAYVLTAYTPSKVIKFRLSDMSRISSVTLNTGENNGRDITYNSGYLYVTTLTNPGIIVKLRASDMTRISGLSLNSGETGQSITNDGTNLYIGTSSSPAKVIKVLMDDMTRSSDLTLASGENSCSAITNDGTYAYLALYTNPTKVVKIRMNDLTKIHTLNLNTGSGNNITHNSNFVYVLNTSSTLVKVWIYPNLGTYTHNVQDISSGLIANPAKISFNKNTPANTSLTPPSTGITRKTNSSR